MAGGTRSRPSSAHIRRTRPHLPARTPTASRAAPRRHSKRPTRAQAIRSYFRTPPPARSGTSRLLGATRAPRQPHHARARTRRGATAPAAPADPPEQLPSFLGALSAAAAGALLSKALGLAREVVVAGVYGVGPAVDAFNHAVILPGFCFVVVGGLNGPIHSGVVTGAANLPRRLHAAFARTCAGLATLAVAPLAAAVLLVPGQLLAVQAPGLPPGGLNAAAELLRGLSFLVLASGATGVLSGLQALRRRSFAATLMPAASSVCTVLAIAAAHARGAAAPDGGALVVGAVAGVVAQIVLQTASLRDGALSRAAAPPAAAATVDVDTPQSLRDDAQAVAAAVRRAARIAGPSLWSAGVMQLAVATDMAFGSYIPGAAAALGYANLIAMAPIGVLSSAILVPTLPALSSAWTQGGAAALDSALARCLIVALVLAGPLATVGPQLALPAAQLLLQRGAMDLAAAAAVASLLAVQICGTPAYLVRDVLARAHLARGDARSPAAVSMAMVALNAALDWWLTRPAVGLGASALVVATAACNAASACALAWLLRARLGPLGDGLGRRMLLGALWVACASAVAGGVCCGACQALTWLGAWAFGPAYRGVFAGALSFVGVGAVSLMAYAWALWAMRQGAIARGVWVADVGAK
ncbi:unnamed protein product [Pedinophyceae sp. YPF-701]|nr:unnamed protein product [Pedinophyceae sp. YPF-701]